MEFTWPLLSLLIWIPIIGGVAVAALGEQKASQARMLALLVSVLTFALSIMLFSDFDRAAAAMASPYQTQAPTIHPEEMEKPRLCCVQIVHRI